MPVLSDQRRERFAQNVACGMTATAAYAVAGYRPNGANAGRLTKNDQVQTRVMELMATAAGEAGVTIKRVVDEVAKVAFASMRDYLEFDRAGNPHIAFDGLSRAQMAAVRELVTETNVIASKEGKEGEPAEPSVTVRKVRFRLHSKLDALEKLGKFVGAWKDGASERLPPPPQVAKKPVFDLKALTDEELKQLIAIKRKMLGISASEGTPSGISK
jgi:phage terminase small subunit